MSNSLSDTRLDADHRKALLKALDWHLEQGHDLQSFNYQPGPNPYAFKWRNVKMSPEAVRENVKNGHHHAVLWKLKDDQVVLDFDNHKGKTNGTKLIPKLTEEGVLAPTRITKTGGNGFHYMYDGLQPDWYLKSEPGVDLKREGGFVVIAGSLHKSGDSFYEFANDEKMASLPEKPFRARFTQPVEQAEYDDLDEFLTEEDATQLVSRFLLVTDPPREREPWIAQLYAIRNVLLRARLNPETYVDHVIEWCERGGNFCEKSNDYFQVQSILASADGQMKAGAPTLRAEINYAVNDEEEALEKLTSLMYAPTPEEKLQARNQKRHLLLDVITENAVSLMVARPNTGKSALALDLCWAIAGGRKSWNGIPIWPEVHGETVFYVAAEGADSITQRALQFDGYLENQTLRTLPTGVSISLSTKEGRLAVMKKILKDCRELEIKRLPLVVIDTLAEATPGLDENSTQIGDVMHWARELASKVHGHVMILHHMAKHSEGPRGHTSGEASADTMIFLNPKEDGEVEFKIMKQRDIGTRFQGFKFRVVGHQLPGEPDWAGRPPSVPAVHFESEFGSLDEQTKSDLAKAEILALLECGEWTKIPIRELESCGKDWANKVLGEMVDTGELERRKSGKSFEYRLVLDKL
jgi:hypothetical protein